MIRANDLDNLQELVNLLDGWKAAAAAAGVDLLEVRVQPVGAYYAAQISLEDAQSETPYWSISG
jgi:hypothetical protein